MREKLASVCGHLKKYQCTQKTGYHFGNSDVHKREASLISSAAHVYSVNCTRRTTKYTFNCGSLMTYYTFQLETMLEHRKTQQFLLAKPRGTKNRQRMKWGGLEGWLSTTDYLIYGKLAPLSCTILSESDGNNITKYTLRRLHELNAIAYTKNKSPKLPLSSKNATATHPVAQCKNVRIFLDFLKKYLYPTKHYSSDSTTKIQLDPSTFPPCPSLGQSISISKVGH